MIERLIDILTATGGASALLNSEAFWLMLLVFYPLYGIAYRRRTAMMVVVTVFSLLFCWRAGGWLSGLIVVRAVIDYVISKAITHSHARRVRKTLLVVGIILSAGTLAAFKYSGVVVAGFAEMVGGNFSLPDMIVPVGISFYTFRSVSYLVDVYRGIIVAPRRLLDYVFYLTYFPVLMAGPIVRASEFFPQIEGDRRILPATLYSGLFLVMKGLLKKAVIADYLSQFNNLVFDNPSGHDGTEALLALLGYSAQIYLDFSGYSDIAIGLSRTLGIELPANFRTPYKAASITDFWRRWHISLSSWLRDYIYIPLGGNRCGRWRMRSNVVVTMIVGGVWHGAGATFLVWGALHGALLVAQKAIGRLIPSFRGDRKVYVVCTFVAVTLLWLPFRCTSLADCFVMLRQMATAMSGASWLAFLSGRTLWVAMLVVAYLLICLPSRISDWAERRFVAMRWIAKLLLFCLLVQLIVEFSGAYVAPFIYAAF